MAPTKSTTTTKVWVMLPLSTADPPQAFRGCHHVGQPDTELVIHHHHFALRNEIPIHQHVHRLARQRVQFHHRPLRQLKDVLDRYLGAPQLHGQLDGDVQHHIDVIDRTVTTSGKGSYR